MLSQSLRRSTICGSSTDTNKAKRSVSVVGFDEAFMSDLEDLVDVVQADPGGEELVQRERGRRGLLASVDTAVVKVTTVERPRTMSKLETS